MNDLFPAEFLRAIDRLSMDVRPAPAGGRTGAHLSRSPGASMEFRDFHAYAAGDDLRRVDWNVYRRTGQLFLRRFERPAAAPVQVLVDNSASMFAEAPSRYDATARVAAAIASAVLRTGDPLTLNAFAPADPDARPPANWTGRRRLHDVLTYLARQAAPVDATLVDAVDRAVATTSSWSGTTVVISDFFHPDGAAPVVEQLSRLPGRLVLVAVTRPTDAEPEVDGEIELIDAESGRATVVVPTPAMLASYRAAYREWSTTLEALAFQRGGPLVRFDAAADPITQLESLFPGGALRVRGGSR